jgi:DNA-binding transcriptional MocR family regulator
VIQLTHSIEAGAGAATIAERIEAAIGTGALAESERLPTVRDLAASLGVSSATVAAAYRTLKERGLVTANTRLGTVVAAQPAIRVRGARSLPANVRDLASGNPDPDLLPPLAPALAAVDTGHKLYGGPVKLPLLADLAAADFAADGVIGDIAIVGGALDGIERVLQTYLRAGDRVVVEDPGWPRIHDLVRAAGLRPEPAAVDEHGLVPAELELALHRGAKAVVATPRGQNPTGAAVDEDRARDLAELLGRYPSALLIEDDYVSSVAGAPYVSLHEESPRWAVIRSVSKVLGPDLRIATMAGDSRTITQVEGRVLLGAGWVSHVLQQMAAHLWQSTQTRQLLAQAGRTYAQRRGDLLAALARYDITASGRTGLGIWVPVTEETAIVQELLRRGWAVSAGERYRFRSRPGLRITTAGLRAGDASRLAADLHEIMHSAAATYAG